jgi:hypothetical protein
MAQSKRKWKVYTTDELKERFQPKNVTTLDVEKDEKVVVPNLSKRRNSAPPGMIHFPPGTFSAPPNPTNYKNHTYNHPSSAPPIGPPPIPAPHPSSSNYLPHQQYQLVTHVKNVPKAAVPNTSPYPNPATRRRTSLPNVLTPHTVNNGSSSNHHPPKDSPSSAPVPAIEHYFRQLHHPPPLHGIDAATANEIAQLKFNTEDIKQFVCTSFAERQILPSFQSLLSTINEEIESEENGARASKSSEPMQEDNRTNRIIHKNHIHAGPLQNQYNNANGKDKGHKATISNLIG